MAAPETALHVVYLEDDELEFLLLERRLATLPLESVRLTRAEDVDQAMRHVLADGVDAYVVDLNLRGGRHGLKFVAEARRHGCTTPMVILTGADDAEQELAALEAGAQGFLSKNDVTPKLFLRTLRFARSSPRSTPRPRPPEGPPSRGAGHRRRAGGAGRRSCKPSPVRTVCGRTRSRPSARRADVAWGRLKG